MIQAESFPQPDAERLFAGKLRQAHVLEIAVRVDAEALADIRARIERGETPVLARHLRALGLHDEVEALARRGV
jgi:hypothetical protein